MQLIHNAVVIAVLVAAGCANIPSVGPDYKELELEVPSYSLPDAGQPTSNLTQTAEYKPAEASDDSRVNVSNELIHRWWERFNDPVLKSLIEGGVSNNIGYLMAQRRLEASSYELLGSYAAFLPKFGVEGAWTRYWSNPNNRSGGDSSAHYNVRNAALDGNWEIDIFGGNRRLCESALAQAQAAGWTVADAWVSLTTQIGQQYINLRTTQELIEVARTNLVLQSETYDILKSRLDSGIGDELAVNQCAYIVEQTRARIPSLLAEEERIKNSLAILAGEMPGSLHEILKAIEVRRDWQLAPQKVAELNLNMMRARPDVKAAERALAAATARIGVAEAAWFPKLYINGTVGWENRYKTRLFSRESFFASLGPAVSWPIFQGGAIYANVKVAEAQAKEAALNYELAIENAYGEVRNAYAAYTQEYLRNKSLLGAVKASSDAVTISQDLYKNGLKDFNNVLDAQRSRLQLEEEFAISRGQITLNLISLYRALGGGLAVDKNEEGKKE
ncbi:MAG: efflux transporter outer membrane subunit [Kiritimatiellae bacterium]|nr:efflux transporter outer membrane subunit [Kiritimatiellia bacterium]